MFESITGILKEKNPIKAVVETHGIAYRLLIPLCTYQRLPSPNTSVLLYLTQVVREDAHILYAFHGKEERDLFELLITLSGVGPKTALSLISHVEVGAFQHAIACADSRLLSKIPGIGKKTAERLIIEMRDKFKAGARKKDARTPLPFAEGNSLSADAMSALTYLGYNPLEAQRAVHAALQERKEETDLARLISASLQKI